MPMRQPSLFFLECKNHYLQGLTLLTPIWFLALVCLLFSISFSPTAELLQVIACPVIWIAILLALLLNFPQLFQQDDQDGVLEQVKLSPTSLYEWVSIKLLCFFLFSVLPMLMLTPIFIHFFKISLMQNAFLCLTLLFASPSLVMIGAFNAALTLRLRQNTLLLTLLSLPLCIPSLLFGIGANAAFSMGENIAPPLCLLSGISLLSIVIFPFLISFALTIGSHE